MIKISEPYKTISSSRTHAMFHCEYCNTDVERRSDTASMSCGCNKNAHKKTHDQCETKLYSVWSNMKDRCLNKNSKRYKNYGGRGISFCDEWLRYEPFMEWATENGYKEGLQLNRVKNNLSYSPSNCDFITLANNNRNKTTTKLSFDKADNIRNIYAGGGYSQRKLAAMFDVPQGTIWKVLKNKAWTN